MSRTETSLTIMFTDMEASSPLRAEVGDAAADEVLDAHDQATRDSVEGHGGRVVKGLGDGLLATFSSARAALTCAVALQRELRAREGPPLLRIGINAGEVLERDGDVHGLAVHAAARIVARADAGQVLLSDVVRQLIGADLTFLIRPVEVARLRGIPGEWALFEAGSSTGDESTQRRVRPDAVDLVGRSQQSRVVVDALAATRGGTGQVVLISGDAGIGKTALARFAISHAVELGFSGLWGTAWDGEGAPAFWPWVQVLRAVIDQGEREDHEALARDLGPVAGDLALLVPEIASVALSAPARRPADPVEARFQLFDAVHTALARRSSTRPLAIVLDDLHWADEGTLQLLSFLSRQLHDFHCLLIGTYRDVEVDTVAGSVLHDLERSATSLHLGGLEVDRVRDLMATVTGMPPPTEIVERVHLRTGGNPFFVREVARLLGSDRGWGEVPDGVRDVVERRLSRLSPPCLDVLSVAAVIGQEIGADVLCTVTGVGVPALLDLLDQAVRERVLAPSPGPIGPYSFMHDLFREVLYENLGPGRRAALHLDVADALEARALTGERAHPADLARHLWLAAGATDPGRVASAARAAGLHATAQLAYEDAATHLGRAASLLVADDQLLATVLLERADADRRAGHREAALSPLMAAAGLARQVGDAELLARVAIAIHLLGSATGEQVTESLVSEAVRLLAPGDSPLRARLLAARVREDFTQGTAIGVAAKAAALATAEEAVAMARRTGDAGALGVALRALHDANWRQGGGNVRVEIATQLIETGVTDGDHELAFDGHMNRLTALLELGDPLADAELAHMESIADRARQPRLTYYAMTRRAALLAMKGRIDDALELSERAAALGLEIGEPDVLTVAAGQHLEFGSDRHERHLARPWIDRLPRSGAGTAEGLWALADIDDDSTPHEAGFRAAVAEPMRRVPSTMATAAAWAAALNLNAEGLQSGEVAGLAMWAGPAIDAGWTDLCQQVYDLLRPHEATCAVGGGTVWFSGSVAHHLGVLAEHLGDPKSAAHYLEQALTVHDALGAVGWAARSRVALGRVLISAGAVERGRDLLQEGSHAASALEMRWLVDQATTALGSTGSQPRLDPDGGAWRVTFRGSSATVKDSKGMHDLAHLLAVPGRETHCAALAGTDDWSKGTEMLDDRAKTAYRQRLAEVDAELDEADRNNDAGRSASLEAERDAIIDELSASLGLGGRSRRLGDPTERARKAVSGRIRDAIVRIDAVHPELGAHLRGSIHTGTFCSYRP